MTNNLTYLLDSSLLIAMASPSHALHQRVIEWVQKEKPGIATCPITQGALLRVAMRIGALSFLEAQLLLESIVNRSGHLFLHDSVPYSQVNATGLVGHQQVTDAYLAQLARESGVKLATLDRAQAALHADVCVWVG